MKQNRYHSATTTRTGSCRLPLTGKRVVHELVTDLGYFKLGPQGCLLVEIAPGVTIEEIREKTECEVKVAAGELPVIAV